MKWYEIEVEMDADPACCPSCGRTDADMSGPWNGCTRCLVWYWLGFAPTGQMRDVPSHGGKWLKIAVCGQSGQIPVFYTQLVDGVSGAGDGDGPRRDEDRVLQCGATSNDRRCVNAREKG